MDKKDHGTLKVLEQIRDALNKINSREDLNELTSEADSLIKRAETRVDEALKKIGSTFDRIHDKLFAFNNILIAAFLGLSKYPADDPIFDLWSAFLPIANLIFLIVLEKTQMEIYRHQSLEMEWTQEERDKHGKMINKQNLRSLVAILFTFGIFSFLAVSVLGY